MACCFIGLFQKASYVEDSCCRWFKEKITGNHGFPRKDNNLQPVLGQLETSGRPMPDVYGNK